VITAASPSSLFADVSVVFVGACSIGFLTTGNATVQLAAPPGMHGRITALWTAAFLGTAPLGALIVGIIDQAAGARASLLTAAAACVVAAVLGLLIRRKSQA
jgi:predicted MFS family arabinose efflux permease